MDVKPGYKTTEFWVTLISMVLPALFPGKVSPDVAVGVAGAAGTIYTAMRSLVKAKSA